MTYMEQSKLALFAENMQVLKREFSWQNTLTKRLAALLYAQEGRPVDAVAIRQSLEGMKRNTGVFSVFRGNLALCVAALLSLSPDPARRFEDTLKVYDLLKGERFHTSDFLAVAAYQIAAQADAIQANAAQFEASQSNTAQFNTAQSNTPQFTMAQSNMAQSNTAQSNTPQSNMPQSSTAAFGNIVTRTRQFYDGMKAHHFFLTGQDDYIFAAMLGLSDVDPVVGVDRMERLFSLLKGEYWDKNSVQALTQVLVLGSSESEERMAARILDLRDRLRAQCIKLDKSYTLPVLGIFALLPVMTDTIVHDIGSAQDALRAQRGFGSLTVSSQELLLYAASMVAGGYAENVKSGVLTATLSTSIANIIIAQEAAMIAAISASSAAAASSGS